MWFAVSFDEYFKGGRGGGGGLAICGNVYTDYLVARVHSRAWTYLDRFPGLYLIGLSHTCWVVDFVYPSMICLLQIDTPSLRLLHHGMNSSDLLRCALTCSTFWLFSFGGSNCMASMGVSLRMTHHFICDSSRISRLNCDRTKRNNERVGRTSRASQPSLLFPGTDQYGRS